MESGRSVEAVADLAHVKAPTVQRFEKSAHWSRDLDALIAAYAYAAKVDDPRDLYQRAIDLWREEGDVLRISETAAVIEALDRDRDKTVERREAAPRRERETSGGRTRATRSRRAAG